MSYDLLIEKLEIVKDRGEAAQIFLGGLLVAAEGGEMRSGYFKNRAPGYQSAVALCDGG